MTPDEFRLAVENAVLDGIAAARRLCPEALPNDGYAEHMALTTLRIDPIGEGDQT